MDVISFTTTAYILKRKRAEGNSIKESQGKVTMKAA
jgi:hypothetical protein